MKSMGQNRKSQLKKKKSEKNAKKLCWFFSYEVKCKINKNYEGDQTKNWNDSFL